jgi:hypothetical protein
MPHGAGFLAVTSLNSRRNTMFTLDTTIDAVQTGKKQFVKTFIQDEKIAEALNQFIDNQTEYTKKATKATMDAGNTVVQESIKHVQEVAKEAGKLDFTKFNDSIMKSFTAQTKTK